MNKLKILYSLLFSQLFLSACAFATDFSSINSNSISNTVGMPMPKNMYWKMKLSEIGEVLSIIFVFLFQILLIFLICWGIVWIFKRIKTFLTDASKLKDTHELIEVKITDEPSNSNEIEGLESKQLYNKMLDTFVGRLNYYFNIPAAFLGPLWFFYRNAVGIGILFAIPTTILIILYAFGDMKFRLLYLDKIVLVFMAFNFFFASKIYVLWSKFKIKKIIQSNSQESKTELLSLCQNNPSIKKAIIATISIIISACVIPWAFILLLLLVSPL